MLISFIPQRSAAQLAVTVNGESVVINGTAYDLSPLIEGQSISAGGFQASRTDGQITVSLPLPYGVDPVIDPMQVVEVEADGVVTVPGHDAQQPAEILPGVIDWPEPPPVPTQRELDELRYKKRAEVKDQLIAFMAADNMLRIRSGEWTVEQLTSLMGDPLIVEALSYMQSLSYEIVASKLQQATHPLMTQEIKDSWISKLQEYFYLEG